MDKTNRGEEQVVHESETQRQYVRVDVKAEVRIDGSATPVENLSAGGLAVIRKDQVYRTGMVFPLSLAVPFQSFSLEIPIKVEVEHYNKESGLTGVRFLDLTKEKISILNHIIRGYIAGDFISAGEILNISSRNNFAKARPQSAPEQDGFFKDIKRFLTLLMIGIVGLGAFYFLVSHLYRGAFTLESVRGVVESDVQEIRSPYAGIFQSALSDQADMVEQGQKIGRIVPSLLGGDQNHAVMEIKSPCTCYLSGHTRMREEYVEAGQALVTLVAPDAPLWISVVVEARQAHRISIGDRADIRIAGSEIDITGTVVRYESSLQDLKNTAAEAGTSSAVTTIIITPEQSLPVDLRERPATVTFRL